MDKHSDVGVKIFHPCLSPPLFSTSLHSAFISMDPSSFFSHLTFSLPPSSFLFFFLLPEPQHNVYTFLMLPKDFWHFSGEPRQFGHTAVRMSRSELNMLNDTYAVSILGVESNTHKSVPCDTIRYFPLPVQRKVFHIEAVLIE